MRRSRRASRPPSAAVLAAFLAIVAGAPAAAQASRNGTPSRVDYAIHARVDTETMTLDGRETIAWTNRSADEVPDLWFHLYWNAFANNRSTHLVEGRGRTRYGHRLTEEWGWMRVKSVRLAGEGGADLTSTFRWRQPDDDRDEDRTVASVDLPVPVAPGDTIEVEVEWEAKIPRVRRRTGYKDDFLLVAHWFPKLGVYESGKGWNCHQFHANSEFFSDYGTYDVAVDLPAEYHDKVFGTGVVVKPDQVTGERVVVRMVAPSAADRERADRTGEKPLVHAFTWTADPDYHVETKTFRFAEWERRFPDEVRKVRMALGPQKDIELRDVRVTLLIQPERAGQAERHFEATSAALFFYGLWYGEYPYEHLTVVDPPWGGSEAGGMEYPTLFTCGTTMFTRDWMHQPESVTVHEAGHQFWYGLVGSNEFEAAWIDEGFNSYADSEVLMRVYGPRRLAERYGGFRASGGRGATTGIPIEGGHLLPLQSSSPLGRALTLREIPIPDLGLEEHVPFRLPRSLRPIRPSSLVELWRDQPFSTFAPHWRDPRWDDRRRYLSSPAADPIVTRAWEHVDRSSYATNSYARTAVVLRTLRGLVGEEAFLRGMRHFSETWRYDHPYSEDFFASFQEGSGHPEDLEWFFEDLFRGVGTVDWIVEVEQARRQPEAGFFLDAEGRFVEREVPEDGEEEEEPWVAEVTLRRRGTLRLPVKVAFGFEDGGREELVWTREEQAEETWLRKRFVGPKKLESVEIDPARAYWIDTDMSNNGWWDEVDELAPSRWAERAFAQFAHGFQFISRLGG